MAVVCFEAGSQSVYQADLEFTGIHQLLSPNAGSKDVCHQCLARCTFVKLGTQRIWKVEGLRKQLPVDSEG